MLLSILVAYFPLPHSPHYSFEWFGIVLMVLFLSGSWIFAMLHVNNGYAEISGATAGWVFMGFSIALVRYCACDLDLESSKLVKCCVLHC